MRISESYLNQIILEETEAVLLERNLSKLGRMLRWIRRFFKGKSGKRSSEQVERDLIDKILKRQRKLELERTARAKRKAEQEHHEHVESYFGPADARTRRARTALREQSTTRAKGDSRAHGAMGDKGGYLTPEKAEIIKKYPELQQLFGKSQMTLYQFLEVVINPSNKPLVLVDAAITRATLMERLTPRLKEFLKSKNLEILEVPHPHVTTGAKFQSLNTSFTAREPWVFIGPRRELEKAKKLFENPWIGKEGYKFDQKFWENVWGPQVSRNGTTPEFEEALGKLLGYGSDNASKYAMKHRRDLYLAYYAWKGWAMPGF